MPNISLFSSFWMLLPGGEGRLKEQARHACEEGDLNSLTQCLNRGLPVDSILAVGRRNDRRVPLVVYAARMAFREGLVLLLERGASPNQKATDNDGGAEPWQDGQSALFSLTFPGSPSPPDCHVSSSKEVKDTLECGRLLIRAGADLEDQAWSANWKVDPAVKTGYDTHNSQSSWRTVREQIERMSGDEGIAWKQMLRQEELLRRAKQLGASLPEPVARSAKPRF